MLQSCSYQISGLRPPELWKLNSVFFFTVWSYESNDLKHPDSELQLPNQRSEASRALGLNNYFFFTIAVMKAMI